MLRLDEWLNREKYDGIVSLLKAEYGQDRISVVRGDDIHASLSKIPGLGKGRLRKDRGATRSSVDPARATLKSKGDDWHGG